MKKLLKIKLHNDSHLDRFDNEDAFKQSYHHAHHPLLRYVDTERVAVKNNEEDRQAACTYAQEVSDVHGEAWGEGERSK